MRLTINAVNATLPSLHAMRLKESTVDVAVKSEHVRGLSVDSKSRNKGPISNPDGWQDVIKEFVKFGVFTAVTANNIIF
jgi:hypothetical protein